MLPLSHTYVSTKVTGRRSTLLVFGSVLPDIATTSKDEISRDKIHYSPKEFYDFVKNRYSSLVDLAIGVRLHSHIEKGADYYSDDSKIGFAKLEGRKIVDDVKELLGTDDERLGLGLAHSFIEAGVDLNLKDLYPKIFDIYSKSFEEINLQVVADCLSEYLGLKKEKVLKELQNFVDFLSPEHLSSVDDMVDGVVVPLIEIKFGKTVSSVKAKQILMSAKRITKDSSMRFLDEAVEKMKVDFADLLESRF